MKRFALRTVVLLVALHLVTLVALATPKTADIFGENMVLQRDRPIPVWGTAEPSEQITVGFEVTGQDGPYVPANARIDGIDTVVVVSEAVPAPVAVRYAWAGSPICNLYNKEDLPASPFRKSAADSPGAEPKE